MISPIIYPACRAEEDPRVLDCFQQLENHIQSLWGRGMAKRLVKIFNRLRECEAVSPEDFEMLDHCELNLLQTVAECSTELLGIGHKIRGCSVAEAQNAINEGKLKSQDFAKFFLRIAEDAVFRNPNRNHPIPTLKGWFQNQYQTFVAAVHQFLSIEPSRRKGYRIQVSAPDGPASLVDTIGFKGSSILWFMNLYNPADFVTYCREYNAYTVDLYAVYQLILARQNAPTEEYFNIDLKELEEGIKWPVCPEFDEEAKETKTYPLDISEETYLYAKAQKEAIEAAAKENEADFEKNEVALNLFTDIVTSYEEYHAKDDNELIQFK